MKTILILLQAILAVSLWAQDVRPATESTESSSAVSSTSSPQDYVLGPVSLASTNIQMLDEVLARSSVERNPLPPQGRIAGLTSRILAKNHYSRQPVDDTISAKFLDRYLETLDNQHMHFLQSDIDEFNERYRLILDDLLMPERNRDADISPAHVIFERFLQRVKQRAAYVAELMRTETFEFSGNDRYNLNRRKAPHPKDLAEAKELWRQHLRYEVLQEKLNKEKPDEISKKIARRYARLLRTFQDLDSEDVFEIYLSALTRVYDPHSDYLGKSGLDSFNIGMRLSLVGIGAQLTTEDGYCKIVSLVPGGPAALSKKLKPNDRIIAVAQGTNEPVDVIDMKLSKVVEMIRGEKGKEVRLTIIPADATDPSVRKTVSLIRDQIKLEEQEAKAKIIDFPAQDGKVHRLGLIDLPSFYADFEASASLRRAEEAKSTTVDVAKLVRKLKREKVEGIILDLRHNGGGSLEEAINLTGLFIKEGPVVQVKDPNNRIMIDEDEDPTVLYDGPLVVLTSRFSASASEILAGALQDYGRALVVGDSSTHGKGTVQSLIYLDQYINPGASPDSSRSGALKMTIRKFYRASGSSTQLKGVTPDIVLPSVNNYAEVGEAALENPLPWDTIVKAPNLEKLNRIQPILPELLSRSAKRLETDQDFAYVREDIEQFRKALADRTVSLNEEQRLKEKAEAEARSKARQAELKARPDPGEKIYEIAVKDATKDGLPEPKTQAELDKKADADLLAQAEETEPAEGEEDAEVKVPAVDATLKETKRILVDLIWLLENQPSIAAQVN